MEQRNVEVIDPDTGEVLTTYQLAEATMAGDLMAVVVGEIQALPKPWPQLSEREQWQALDRIRNGVDATIAAAVNILATRGFDSVAASVESVTFKGGVKAVLTLTRNSGAHELADNEGRQVCIVFADPQDFAGRENAPKATRSQGELPLDQAPQGDGQELPPPPAENEQQAGLVCEHGRTAAFCTICLAKGPDQDPEDTGEAQGEGSWIDPEGELADGAADELGDEGLAQVAAAGGPGDEYPEDTQEPVQAPTRRRRKAEAPQGEGVEP